MSPARSFAVTSRLGLTTMVTMFGLIIVGSVVRTTGSGLACPDWPLCQGRLIPPFQFNVLIEWFHRLLALVVSLMLATTVGSILFRGPVRRRLGALAALSVLLLAVQILLGALTVWKLLDPAIVGGHLAVALLLFTTLLVITLGAESEAQRLSAPQAAAAPVQRPAGLLPVFAIVAGLTYGQAVLGGAVSTNHAGLVCPDWPTCNGVWFPPMRGLVGLQMAHRYGAYLLVCAMVVLFVRSWNVPDPGAKAAARMAFGLTLAQVVLGVSNVFLGTPPWLSAAHLATATAILALTVTGTYRVASIPAAPRTRAAGHAIPTATESGGGIS